MGDLGECEKKHIHIKFLTLPAFFLPIRRCQAQEKKHMWIFFISSAYEIFSFFYSGGASATSRTHVAPPLIACNIPQKGAKDVLSFLIEGISCFLKMLCDLHAYVIFPLETTNVNVLMPFLVWQLHC